MKKRILKAMRLSIAAEEMAFNFEELLISRHPTSPTETRASKKDIPDTIGPSVAMAS